MKIIEIFKNKRRIKVDSTVLIFSLILKYLPDILIIVEFQFPLFLTKLSDVNGRQTFASWIIELSDIHHSTLALLWLISLSCNAGIMETSIPIKTSKRVTQAPDSQSKNSWDTLNLLLSSWFPSFRVKDKIPWCIQGSEDLPLRSDEDLASAFLNSPSIFS